VKLYRITVIDSYGERFVVMIAASSVYEAVRHIETDKGWNVAQVETF